MDEEGDTPLGLSLRHCDDETVALLRVCGASDPYAEWLLPWPS